MSFTDWTGSQFNDPSRYTVSDDGCTGKSLGPNKSCSFVVNWQRGTPDSTASLNVVGARTATSQFLYDTVIP